MRLWEVARLLKREARRGAHVAETVPHGAAQPCATPEAARVRARAGEGGGGGVGFGAASRPHEAGGAGRRRTVLGQLGPRQVGEACVACRLRRRSGRRRRRRRRSGRRRRRRRRWWRRRWRRGRRCRRRWRRHGRRGWRRRRRRPQNRRVSGVGVLRIVVGLDVRLVGCGRIVARELIGLLRLALRCSACRVVLLPLRERCVCNVVGGLQVILEPLGLGSQISILPLHSAQIALAQLRRGTHHL